MKILTTGVQSGMGRYIRENLGGFGLDRDTSSENIERLNKEGVDVIIHCAFNSEKETTSENLYRYFKDNMLLTNELVSIPHKKFVFFSTVDLYPEINGVCSENKIIRLDEVKGLYAVSKLISESIIRNYCRDYLILRPTTLVGRYSRKNTLLRLMDGDTSELYLSGDSRFNYVLHADVLDFIKFAIDNDISGIYNVASSENILLSEVTAVLGRKIQFGNYLYDVGNLSNIKITSLFQVFRKTSKEVLNQFIGDYASA